MSGRRHAGALAAFAIAATAWGCSLISGLGDDYRASDAPGGAEDASVAADAARAPTDAGAETLDDAAADVAGDVGSDADAAAPDAHVAAGCADAGYLFCDDFEGTLAAWSIPSSSLGTVTLDPTFACSGAKSAHFVETITSPAAGTVYSLSLARTSSLPGDVFVRVFVRIVARPTPDVAFLQLLNGPAGVQEEINSGSFNGENYNFAPSHSWIGVAARVGPCECVEMEINRGDGHVRVWVDGTKANDTSFGTGAIPAFDTLQLGPSVKSPSTQSFTEEIWLDDVAYDDKRIGCNL